MSLELNHALAHCVERNTFKKNQIVYRSGSAARGFYYVSSGLIGLYQVSESGKESLLRIYGADSYFGYRSLFTHQNYPATARAMTDSTILKVDLNTFKELYSLDEELANSLMEEVCFELGEAEKRLMQYNAFDAKKRILDALYYMFDTYPEYPWTYREIGEFSGTDVTTVIRYSKTLKASGVLSKESRKPKLVDLQSLSEYRQSLLSNV